MKYLSWIFFVLMLIYLSSLCSGQYSKCPATFTFDEKNTTSNTWFGTIHLKTDILLHGVFLDLIFDRRVSNVGTYFYDVTTTDHIAFHIVDRDVKLKPSDRINLGFYVRFNSNLEIPNLKEIRLNGRNICSEMHGKNSSVPIINSRNKFNAGTNLNEDVTESGFSGIFTKLPENNRNDNRDRPFTRTTPRTTTEPFLNTRTTTRSSYFGGDLAVLTSRNQESENRLPSQPETCGSIAQRPNPLIVNSNEDSYPGKFPWHAALYVSVTANELKYICGGSLISLKAVISAAHCVTLERTTRPIEPENLVIYLGKYNLRKWTGPIQHVEVTEILIHPKYDNEKFYSDIALLKIKDEAKFSDFIRPVCLWDFSSDVKSMITKIGYVPGWGYNEFGIVSEDLSYVQMPIVAHETCIWSDRDFFSRITSDVSYCAGFRNGSSVCNGDSGGGMVFLEGNKWYLRGIVSVSIALQNHFLCDPNHYAVFTDVAKFVSWIRNNL